MGPFSRRVEHFGLRAAPHRENQPLSAHRAVHILPAVGGAVLLALPAAALRAVGGCGGGGARGSRSWGGQEQRWWHRREEPEEQEKSQRKQSSELDLRQPAATTGTVLERKGILLAQCRLQIWVGWEISLFREKRYQKEK